MDDLAAKIEYRPGARLPHNAMSFQVLLANVHRRLVSYEETGDPGCVTNEDTIVDVQRLHEATDQLPKTEKQLWMQAQQLLGLIHYARYEALHRRRGDRDTEKREFTVDTSIPPRGVLSCQAQDEPANRGDRARRAPGSRPCGHAGTSSSRDATSAPCPG